MPIIVGTSVELTTASNVVMARAYAGNLQGLVYPELCGSYVSVKPVEPFSALGSTPPLRLFGSINGQGGAGLIFRNLQSFSMQVPNLLFKNGFGIAQSALEFDQTRTIKDLSSDVGISLATFPDQLQFKRLIYGSNSSSSTVVWDYNGATYPVTLDGVSFFNTNHPTGVNGMLQSNIVSGSLPATVAGIQAQDVATTAQQMQTDYMAMINTFQTVTNTQGEPMFPNLDPEKSLVLVVPPILREPAKLAFATPGAIIAQSTAVTAKGVRKVISSGYLGPNGYPDPEDSTGLGLVKPVNATDWYGFITDYRVKPFYFQIFRPIRGSQLFPGMGEDGGLDWNPETMARSMAAKYDIMTPEQATVYASTRIDTTFNKIGANADLNTIVTENFVVSGRLRGNLVYGPHFLGAKVKPVGGN